MNPTQFHAELTRIVQPGTPGVLRIEGGDSSEPLPVEVVRLSTLTMSICAPLAGGGIYVRPLEILVKENMTTQEVELAHLYAKWQNYDQYVYRVPVGKPSAFWLYLLVHFAGEAVGVRYFTVET